MAEIVDHIDFQTLLQTATLTRASFGIGLFLVDDEQIPIDVRFRYTTKNSKADDFTSGTVPRDYADVYFQQSIVAESLMVGRWAKVATNPLFVCGPAYEKDYLVWKAVTDGTFTVQDNTTPTPLEDDLTGVTFVAITALSQVADVLTAAIQAIGAPNITGLDTSEFEFDSLGRLVLKMSTSGAAAKSVTIIPEGTGTDLSAAFMDATNGSSVAGIDAEEPTDAKAAIQAIDNSFYNIQIRGESDAQQEALAANVESDEKLLDLFITAAAAKDPGSTTDVPYKLKALSYTRTFCIYSEKTTEYPDAAAAGNFLPAKEGTKQFEWKGLVGVTDSGDPNPLDLAARTALKNKNCSYLEALGNIVILYNGLSAGGIEKRIMLGRDWFNARNREDIFLYQTTVDLAAFDNETLAALEEIIKKNMDEAIDRRIGVNTASRPATVSFPDADDISQAERDSHKLEQFNVFQMYLNSAIHDYKIVGVWTQ
jgi:hypothetical protein